MPDAGSLSFNDILVVMGMFLGSLGALVAWDEIKRRRRRRAR